MNKTIYKQLFFYSICIYTALSLTGCLSDRSNTISQKERFLKNILNSKNISEKDLYIRGLIKLELFEYLSAINDFEKLKAINHNNSEYFFYNGVAKKNFGDYRGAVKELNKAIMIDNKKEIYYTTRASLYYDLKQYKKAKRQAKQTTN